MSKVDKTIFIVYYISVNTTSHKSGNKPPFTVFLAATVMIFFLSLSTADSIGFVPDYIDGSATASAGSQSIALASLPELGEETPAVSGIAPERLIIPAIDLDLAVQNPATRDINALDALLQNGPARYVDSAKLGEQGNMIIFAHSSNLPIVRNKMYQAFNKIPSLRRRHYHAHGTGQGLHVQRRLDHYGRCDQHQHRHVAPKGTRLSS